MRLINVKTFELEDFSSKKKPDYAILSHRWTDEEITFQDFQNGVFTHCFNTLQSFLETLREDSTSQPGVTLSYILDSGNSPSLGDPCIDSHRAGLLKIFASCEMAGARGLDWIWIDTCCIDKSSSAELSESINSMYKWYEGAVVCYAYLADVETDRSAEDWSTAFERSQWFERGWTLQELIAPSDVVFFSKRWSVLGTKHELAKLISRVTRIDIGVLCMFRWPKDFCIAVRMSWASRRQTTRPEDRAYSLLGIFGVHMPLLYGEGHLAFTRLQEVVVKQTTDTSIFAWERPQDYFWGVAYFELPDLLAPSPSEFERGYRLIHWDIDDKIRPYNISNVGLETRMLLLEADDNTSYVGVLPYCFDDEFEGPIGLGLRPENAPDNNGEGNERRSMSASHICQLQRDAVARAVWTDVCILSKPRLRYGLRSYFRRLSFARCFRLRVLPSKGLRKTYPGGVQSRPQLEVIDVYPADQWNIDMTAWRERYFVQTTFNGAALLKTKSGSAYLVIGFKVDKLSGLGVWASILDSHGLGVDYLLPDKTGEHSSYREFRQGADSEPNWLKRFLNHSQLQCSEQENLDLTIPAMKLPPGCSSGDIPAQAVDIQMSRQESSRHLLYEVTVEYTPVYSKEEGLFMEQERDGSWRNEKELG